MNQFGYNQKGNRVVNLISLASNIIAKGRKQILNQKTKCDYVSIALLLAYSVVFIVLSSVNG